MIFRHPYAPLLNRLVYSVPALRIEDRGYYHIVITSSNRDSVYRVLREAEVKSFSEKFPDFKLS